MNKINIDVTKSDDSTYRYKMYPIQTKDEGAGNGMLTVLTNLEEVATDLNRSPSMIITYLASVLGCKHEQKGTGDKIKWILTGRISRDTIQAHIHKFISYFVLCKCKNPETYFVHEKRDINLKCKACSQETDIVLNSHTMKAMKQLRLTA